MYKYTFTIDNGMIVGFSVLNTSNGLQQAPNNLTIYIMTVVSNHLSNLPSGMSLSSVTIFTNGTIPSS